MNSDSNFHIRFAAAGEGSANRWSVGVVVLALVAPLMWGCPDGVDAPPPSGVDEPELELAVTVEDVRALRESRDEYHRPDRQQPRDPFRPDLSVLGIDFEDEVVDEETDERHEPLVRYPLSSLELVAVISETATPRAMFIGPSGDGHFALEGMEIGQNGGRIISIRSGDLHYPAEVDVDKGEAGVETVALSERRIRPARDEDDLAEEVQAVLDRLGVPEDEREEVGRELQEGLEQQQDDELPQLAPPGQD